MKRRVEFVAALFLLAGVSVATSQDTRGPPFGANRYDASIARSGAESDTDDYVASLVQGERLTVTVRAAKGSTRLPRLTLVGPGGVEIVPPVRIKARGRSLSLRGFVVPETGRWAVRVAGISDTQGAYSIATSIATVGALRTRNLPLAGPTETILPFDATDGALLDVSISWHRGEPPVSLAGVEDPDHRLRSAASAIAGGSSIALSRVVLEGGDGRYGLHLLRAAGGTPVDVTIRVTPQGRPKSRRAVRLADAEPWIEPRDVPILGIPGRVITLNGGNLSESAPPTVWIGGFAVAPRVLSGGAAMEVIVPDVAQGATVAVAVVGADGQGCVRPRHFRHLPPPAITDLVDDSGTPVRAGGAAGGQVLWLQGTDFDVVQSVTFDGSAAAIVAVVGATRVQVVVPPGGGPANVSVQDAFGRTAVGAFAYEFKAPPRVAADGLSPAFGSVAAAVEITLTGSGFDPSDVVEVDGKAVASAFVDATTIRFTSPALAAGAHTVAVIDRFGGSSFVQAFDTLAAPEINSVEAFDGPILDSGHIAAGGGARIRVYGRGFLVSDTVRLGGVDAQVTDATDDVLTFTTAELPRGDATLVVTDPAGQTAELEGALKVVAWYDDTDHHTPPVTAAEDFTALRGAVADLDGDGIAGEIVIVSDASSPGTREEHTRLLVQGTNGLSDVTAARLPAAFSDAAGVDSWRASAVAIGDVDGDGTPDVVIAGPRIASELGSDREARLLVNDGAAVFTGDKDGPLVRADAWNCIDASSGYAFTLFQPAAPVAGGATALAVGDIDGDGDADIVMGTDRFRTGTLHMPLSSVSISGDFGYASDAGADYSYAGIAVDAPAVRVFENRKAEGEAFRDVTFTRLPRTEESEGLSPAFHSRDLKLGDVDGDGDLDIVLTWDDPTSVTPFGLVHPGEDEVRVATRVLVNDGAGTFADATADWMPAAVGCEAWQANRLLLADLDGDGDPDLLLLHGTSIDAYAGSPTFGASALRILRNDGPGAGFVDVTPAALPGLPLAGTADDNLRGQALAVVDFDRDGVMDIVVGTTERLSGASGPAVRSMRLLRGTGNLTFADARSFLPGAACDTGEVNDILVSGITGIWETSLVLLTETPAAVSTGAANLRVFDWE